MGWYRRVYFLCILLFLTACASQVELPEDFWQGSPGAVGIVFVRPPTMDTHRGGRKSLLDAAIEEAFTDVVETHLASLSLDHLEKSSSQIKEHIEARGATAVIIPEYYEASNEYLLLSEQRANGRFKYDVSFLREQYFIDYLLVIQVLAAGTLRYYYRFIPLSDPRGYIRARATLVDLADNRIVFNEEIVEEVEIEKGLEWDDPDNGFPALTAAVEKALNEAGATLIQTLFK